MPQDLVVLIILVDQIGAIGDAGIAPIGRRHDDLAIGDDALDRLQGREDVGPVGELGGVDRLGDLGLDEGKDGIGAGMHDVGVVAAANLLQRLVLIGEDREIRRLAMLGDIGFEEGGLVVAAPFHAGQHLVRAPARRHDKRADAEGGSGAEEPPARDLALRHAVDEFHPVHIASPLFLGPFGRFVRSEPSLPWRRPRMSTSYGNPAARAVDRLASTWA